MIKRIFRIVFSSQMTIILLVILAIALAVATFIEDKYDTQTSKELIYNTKWLEGIFFLLVLNLAGHIYRYKLLSRKKWAGFTFHFAFVVIILGAGVTRYFGFEGSMTIREGETSDIIYSAEPYFQVSIQENGMDFTYSKPFIVSRFLNNSYHQEFSTSTKGKIVIDYKKFIPNAVQKIKENTPGGKNMIEIMTAGECGQKTLLIAEGTSQQSGNIGIGFKTKTSNITIDVFEENGLLKFLSPDQVVITDMARKAEDTIAANTAADFKAGKLYQMQGSVILLNRQYTNAVAEWQQGASENEGADLLEMEVTVNGKKQEAYVQGGPDYILQLQRFTFDDLTVHMGYGEKPIQLPFSIRLNDFILERYPGSMSPSSYASEVTLIDKRNNLTRDSRIFMNNVLDYDKYRFFQSSYEKDEKGTILSVNHDYYGTRITYFGYALLILGFILTLLNRNSRFYFLAGKIGEIKRLRKTGVLMVLVFLGANLTSFGQQITDKPIPAFEAEKFGHLLNQTFDGRFEPVHSLAFDMMHKISRKDKLEIKGKGEMNAMQIMLDILVHPEFWRNQKMIYVREKSVQEVIGIDSKYAAFLDFFDDKREYKLQKYIDVAFRKKQSEQNSFDKEIIKVDERVNIFSMAMNGSMMRIFPGPQMANNKWVSLSDQEAVIPITGAMGIINEDLQLPQLNYRNLMAAYLREALSGISTGDFSKADKIIYYLNSIQRKSAGEELLASESKINTEILYNKLQIFIFLRNFYAVLSIILLVLAFIDDLSIRKYRIITWGLNISTGFLGLGFLYHSFGLALRWYITGHAPWSNGYESLLLVAWGGLLAGFLFVRYSKITLAATTLLAFFMLMTACHSSYDPQLTNLQPVLKSYWLIIHVATLTISYGFLGLGFFLGLINLMINLFKSARNRNLLDPIILELSSINEMNLIIGLALATIGTFLGGIWANESWGRYWGWDAKETWALIIVIVYTLVLHLRFIPKLKNTYVFNVASVLGFGSVIMTFVGVNYYLSKGLHSYGTGDTPVFPVWGWLIIISLFVLILLAGLKERLTKK